MKGIIIGTLYAIVQAYGAQNDSTRGWTWLLLALSGIAALASIALAAVDQLAVWAFPAIF